MSDTELLSRYNYDAFVYDAFVPEQFEPWMRFDASPPLGQPAPDFPLWALDGGETSLRALWSRYAYTVVEFGSFT